MAKIFIQHLKIIFLSSGARADAAIEPADPDVGGGECCQEEAETDQRRTRSGRSSWSPPARPRSSPCPLLVSSIPPPPQTCPKVEEACHQEDLRPARGKVGRSPAGRKSTEKDISASTSAEKAATNKKSNNKKSQAANSDSSSDNSNSSSDSKSSDSDSNSDNENEISE